jgi:transposase
MTTPRVLDGLDAELVVLRRQITTFARRQPGCRALQQQYGVGPITAAAIWAQLGDTRRFSASRKAVRHTGLDVTVYSSDGKRTPGHLSRQGSPTLRWALFEAGTCAAHPSSPDYDYYTRVKDRCGGNRAALSMARKIAPTVPPHPPELLEIKHWRRCEVRTGVRICPQHRCPRPAPAGPPPPRSTRGTASKD